jgi:RNA-binding protein
VSLTGKQKRHLRALGNTLDPVVRTGKDGIDEGVVSALDRALEQHELVKVKLGANTPEDRDELAALLSEQTRSEIAQVMGGTVLLYRARKKDPVIVLPASKGA